MMDLFTDEDLIKKIVLGDLQAFEILVKRYQNLVFTICKNIVKDSFVAEDVAQEIFLKIYQKIGQFRFESSFKTWLYKICYHTCFHQIKLDIKNNNHFSEELLNNKSEDSLGVLELLTIQEKNNFIKEAIQELEPLAALLIRLYYYEDYAIKEISQITSLSESNIKIQLFRARKILSLLIRQKMYQYV